MENSMQIQIFPDNVPDQNNVNNWTQDLNQGTRNINNSTKGKISDVDKTLKHKGSISHSLDGLVGIDLNQGLDDSNGGGFYLRWEKLNYFVKIGPTSKQILNDLRGFFLSNELVALMGPSGAGKTTLLESLSMQRVGLSGELFVVGKPKIRVAMVPQRDDFLPQLTVSETLYFASRFKNQSYEISHGNVVKRVIRQLGLDTCQNERLNRCSGGQRKRVAIGQELVKKPNILLLDEPTSGLDSSSCYQTMEVLRRIIDSSSTSTPLSIVTTIHQPSAKVISLFDRVILLAAGGRLAFNGSPSEILTFLDKIGAPCPSLYNPVDHMIEVVSGDYGDDKTDLMIKYEQDKQIHFDDNLEQIIAQPLKKAIICDPWPFQKHIWIHTQRSTIQLVRDPVLFSARIILHLIMPIFYAYIWGFDIGNGTGCPTFNRQGLNPISVALAANLTRDEIEDMSKINSNLVYCVYGALFAMYAAGMITVLSFPLDVKVLTREYRNGWYSVGTYLIGKIISDAPFQTICVSIFTGITYYITNQPRSDYHWRFMVFAYSLACLSLLAQTQGLIVGTVFMNNLSAAVFAGPLTILPLFLYSGFVRRYVRTPRFLRPIVKMSYFHHAVNTIYASLYGFGRCKCNPNKYQTDIDSFDYDDLTSYHNLPRDQSNQTNDLYIGRFKCDESFGSLVLVELNIEDNDMYIGIVVLMIYLIVLRFVVLLLLMYKVRR